MEKIESKQKDFIAPDETDEAEKKKAAVDANSKKPDIDDLKKKFLKKK